MSCITKFQTAEGFKVSGSYYAATNLAGALGGKALYESTLSERYENVVGFDWTEKKPSFSPYLNKLGEPTIKSILNINNIELDPELKEGLSLIEEMVNDGKVGATLPTRQMADTIISATNLNPRLQFVSLEVEEREGRFYLKAKATKGTQERLINKNHLSKFKFHPVVIGAVDNKGKGFLNSLIDNVLELEELKDFQRSMLTAFRDLSAKNPTLQIIMPDQTDTPIDNSFYDPKSNTIYISKDAYEPQSTERLIRDLVHELAHAYTLSALNNPRTAEERAFKAKMEKAFLDYTSSVLHPDFSYGFTNVEEFVAEFMSNPYFREHLENLDSELAKPKNFIQSILQALSSLFRTIFGFKAVDTKTDIETAIQEYLDYLETQQDIPNNVSEFHLRFNALLSKPVEDRSLQLRPSSVQQKTKFVDREFLKNVIPDYAAQYKNLMNMSMDLLSQRTMSETILNAAQYYAAGIGLSKTLNTIVSDNSIDRLTPEKKYKLVFEIKFHILPKLKQDFKRFSDYLDVLNSDTTLTAQDKEELAKVFTEVFDKAFENVPQVAQINEKAKEELKKGEKTPLQIFNNQVKSIGDLVGLTTDSEEKIYDYIKESVYDALIPQLKDGKLVDDLIHNLKIQQANLEKEFKKSRADLLQNDGENEGKHTTYKNLSKLIDTLEQATTGENKAKVIGDLFINNVYTGTSQTSGLSLLEPLFKSGRPIVQLFAAYLENASLENQTFQKVVNQITDLKGRLDKIRPIQSLIGTTLTARYYKNIIVSREYKYIDNGELKTIKKAFLNTEVDYVKFHNEYTDLLFAKQEAEKKLNTALSEGVDPAQIADLETALEGAEEAYNNFIENNTELQFTDEYYAIQDIIDKDENGVKDEIGKQLRERLDFLNREADTFESFKGLVEDDLIEDYAYSEAKIKRAEIKELRNFFDREGNLKTGIELEWAKRLNKYYQAISDAKVYTQLTEQEPLDRFDFVKKKFEGEISRVRTNLSNLQSDYLQLLSDPNRTDLNRQNLDKRIAETKQELKQAEERYKKWIRQNTQTQIKPEFYTEVLTPIFEEMQSILGERDENIKEINDLLRRIIAPKKDEDGIPVGTNFTEPEVKKVRELQEKIEELKQLKDSLDLTQDQRDQLSDLFSKLSEVQEKTKTSYYYAQLDSQISYYKEKIRNTPGKLKEINEIVEQAWADIARVKAGQPRIHLDNPIFTQNVDIYDALDIEDNPNQAQKIMIEAYLKHLGMEAMYESDPWYKLHHFIDTPTMAEEDIFGVEVYIQRTKGTPLMIWEHTLPTDPQYINISPNGIWKRGQIDERFKNPNYQDKKLSPKKSLYVNTGFSQLTAEEQSIAKEYEKIFDELNEGLPSYYQLENYALPTRQKTYMEQTTPLQDLSKWDRFKGILANPIMRFIREFVSNKDYDRDSEYAALEQYDLSSGEMAPRRLFKNRNMDIADQSLNLNRLLLEFAAHSSATKNLIDIIPQTAFFKEIDKKTEAKKGRLNKTERQELDRFISRIFLGSGNLNYREDAKNQFIRLFNKWIGGVRKMTASAVLSFNYRRAFKQFISQNSKIYLVLRQNGISRREAFLGFFKALTKFQTNFNFHLGVDKDSMSKTTLMYMHMNAIPGSEYSNVASKGLKSKFEKWATLNTLSAATVGYADFVAAATTAEVLFNRKYDIDGEMVRFNDLYTVKDGELVIVDRFRDGGPKEQRVKALTINLRNQIYDINYSGSGQYYKRSQASWMESEFLQTVFFLKGKWFMPSVANHYGGSRVSINSGKVHHSIYFSDRNIRLNLLKEKKLGKALFLSSSRSVGDSNTVVGAAKNLAGNPMVLDTTIALGIRALAYVAQFKLNALLIHYAGALASGDDEWDEALQKYLKFSFYLTLLQADTEVTTITNPVIKAADSYYTYQKYANYKMQSSPDLWRRAVNFILDTTIDATARAAYNKFAMFFDSATWGDPTSEEYQYTETGFLPKYAGKQFGVARRLNTLRGKSIDEAPPKLLVALTTFFNLAPVDHIFDPERQAKMSLMYGDVKILATNEFQEFRRITNEFNDLKVDLSKEIAKLITLKGGTYFYNYNAEAKVNENAAKIFSKLSELDLEKQNLLKGNKVLYDDLSAQTFQSTVSSSIRTTVEGVYQSYEGAMIKENLEQYRAILKERAGLGGLSRDLKNWLENSVKSSVETAK